MERRLEGNVPLLLVPALGAALVVMVAVRYLGGERLAPLAAALALTAGIVAALLVADHFERETFVWKRDQDRTRFKDLRFTLAQSLEPSPAESTDKDYEPPPIQPSHAWLPWLMALAMAVELYARLPHIPVSLGWVSRTLVALLAGRMLTPADVRADMVWSSWLLALVILVEWAVLTYLAREWKDGTIPASLALCCHCAAIVILYAGWASLVDWPLLVFAALLAVAGVAWVWEGDTGGGLPAVAIFLPGTMLNAQQGTFSNLSWHTFALVAVAPLSLTLMLIPALQRLEGWKRWLAGIGLPLIPAVSAIVLAAQVETLPF